MQQDQSTHGHLRTVGFWLKPAGKPFRPFSEHMSPQAIGHPGYTGNYLGIDPVHDLVVAITSPCTRLQSDFDHYGQLTAEVWQHLS